MIKVVIIDDESLVRAGLRMILQSADDIEVVGEAGDGADAVRSVLEFQPDVVLMDIRMPKLDGLAATQQLVAMERPPRVIVLTTFDLDDYVFRALQAGAAGFLLKDTPPVDLIQAVRVIAGGDGMLSPAVTRRLIGHFAADARVGRKREALAQLDSLTEREHEVLIAVGRGMSNADIGKELYMSEATVKAHVSKLLVKLTCANRVQVAILAHDAGLLD